MKIENYKRRIVDDQIEHYLKLFGAVCIEGPKYCGKTWAGRYHSNSEVLLHKTTGGSTNNVELAKMSPTLILEGEKPKLIDEWQEATNLWDEIRIDVDKTGKKGQYILTGSSTPNRTGIAHSGAGRYGKIYLRTMSLFESGDSSGAVSLEELCNHKLKEKFTGEVDLRNLAKLIIRGGWPGNLDYNSKDASEAIKAYIDLIIDDDLARLDGIRRDKHKLRLLLKSLARNESTTVSNKKLKDDISEIDNEDIDIDTLASYLDALSRLYLLDNDEPFSTNIRSSVRVKQSEKRHFADPSIACALLNISEEDKLIHDLNTFGFLFEAMVERDLKIYANCFHAKCYHYQDYQNKEIDCVIELENGNWCAFEIKLGANKIEEGAKNLLRIKKEIEKEKGKVPSILCVICGLSNVAYQRPDGVYVVPITALKP
ncbi:MAG: ATP-binding protein [Clostridia bacterium]|jgi:predicted AAA+ superfamily ATPase|nr:ATP-binding protein [Clostridia bacterium]